MQEYLIDLNATQAAIRAGYKEKTAGSVGNENLKKPEIQKALQTAQQKRSKRTECTQDYVIRKLMEITEKDASDEPESKLKVSNKIRALELLGKHVGAFERSNDTEEGVQIIDDL